MATFMLRNNLINSMKLQDKVLGSLCSFALISKTDNDHRYEEKFSGNSTIGRLRC